MAILHDANVRSGIETRVRRLTPETRGRWGKMSVDQMLWHVNQAMAAAVGEIDQPDGKPPLPRGVMKFLVLKLPWVRNAPTLPGFVAKASHDFDAEKQRCLRLVKALADRPIEGVWMEHPLFGAMTGADVSRLHAKHLDHHLTQFGA